MVFYKKKGYPKEKEIVLCKVKKILPHSVFAELVEYHNKEGMIHISELSNRWTKNINNVVSVGEKIVCRVERINKKKGYIDLSKKRATSGEEKNKKNEVKNENRVEKLINHVCKKNGVKLEEFYDKTGFNIVKEYGSLYNYYQEFTQDEKVINDLKMGKKVKEGIKQAFNSLMKKNRVSVKQEVKFYAQARNGLENLKKFVKKVKSGLEMDDSELEITYINAPNYLIRVESRNYKTANKIVEEFKQRMEDLSKEYNIKIVE